MKFAQALLLASLSAVAVGCGPTTRHLPIASAVIVHACAAAEANYYMQRSRGSSDAAIAETTVELGADGGGKFSGGVKDWASVEGVRNSAKKVDVKVTQLPSFQQCRAWGYFPQLGKDGCLHGGAVQCEDFDHSASLPPAPCKAGSGARARSSGRAARAG